MNKQEAIERIEKRKSTLNGWEELTRNRAFNEALDIVRKIDEPHKVVVPKFVAEWLKKYRYAHTLLKVLNAVENEQVIPSTVNDWILDNQYDFIKAWIDGWDIVKEEEIDE